MHVAVAVKRAGSRENIWIYDTERGTRVPLDANIAGPTLNSPRWSPDGKQMAYRRTRGKTSAMYVRASDGSGETRQVGPEIEGGLTVQDWSPDGRYLAYDLTKFLGPDNWKDTLQVIPINGVSRPVFEIQDAADVKFSPDGRWLSYSDHNTGQIYVTRFPSLADRMRSRPRVETIRAATAMARSFFRFSNDEMLFSVQVRETAEEFRVLSAHLLFLIGLPKHGALYGVSRDGKRFLIDIRTPREELEPLTIDSNWLSSVGSH